MSATHSATPWRALSLAPGNFVVLDPIGKKVAELHLDDVSEFLAEVVQADARLIAASPRLLRVARYCHGLLRDHAESADRVGVELCADAIEAATGVRP